MINLRIDSCGGIGGGIINIIVTHILKHIGEETTYTEMVLNYIILNILSFKWGKKIHSMSGDIWIGRCGLFIIGSMLINHMI